MRLVPLLPFLLIACDPIPVEGDPCDVGEQQITSNGVDLICQCNDDSAAAGPCVTPGVWRANPVRGACDDPGERDCNGSVLFECQCDPNNPLIVDCPGTAIWTQHAGYCEDCDLWLNGTCNDDTPLP